MGTITTALFPQTILEVVRARFARVALLAQVPGTFYTATRAVSTDVTFVRAGPVFDQILTFLRPGLDVPLLGSPSHLSCTRRLPSPIGTNLVATAAISRLYADRGLVIPKRHLVENRQIPASSVAWRLATYIHSMVPFPSTILYPRFTKSHHLAFGYRLNTSEATSTTSFRRHDTSRPSYIRSHRSHY